LRPPDGPASAARPCCPRTPVAPPPRRSVRAPRAADDLVRPAAREIVPSLAAAGAGALLLAGLHGDVDRGTGERELLAQLALDEADIAGIERSRGEEHELRRARAGLRR